MKLLWFVTVLGAFQLSYGAKILSLVPVPTRSHHILMEKLSNELANRGHEVTFITPYKQSNPPDNLKEIIIPDLYKNMTSMWQKSESDKEEVSSLIKMRDYFKWWSVIIFPLMGSTMIDMVLSVPEVQNLIKSEEKFDLILGETVMDEAFIAGFSYKHKAPIVALNTFLPGMFANSMVGNPAPASYISDPLLGYSSRMTFLERLENALYGLAQELGHRLIYLPAHDKTMRKYFGEDLPPLKNIISNTSLVLINHHFSLAFPRPYLPNMVEIGGFHVDKPKPLPADLEKYLNESKLGVILFSMGSHLKSTDLSTETKQGILKAFSRLKQNVLWKFEDDTLTNLPNNVKISKWLPQSDILAHPNLKLFITHGGLLSTTEAVARGVPLIGIPIAGDQPVNMKIFSDAGFGITLEVADITEDVFYEAIKEVLTNPKYKENIKRGSTLLQDTPLSALNTAMYWIEYVIRHKGAPHLRSAAQDLKWYQLYLLDVLGVLLIISMSSILVSYYVTKFIVKFLLALFIKKPVNVITQKKEN